MLAKSIKIPFLITLSFFFAIQSNLIAHNLVDENSDYTGDVCVCVACVLSLTFPPENKCVNGWDISKACAPAEVAAKRKCQEAFPGTYCRVEYCKYAK